jgi:hypothetical protein
VSINTACWRIYESLKKNPAAGDDDWRELCYLWGSDFRTHITEKRWIDFQGRLRDFERRVSADSEPRRDLAYAGSFGDVEDRADFMGSSERVERNGRYLIVETDAVRARLNCRRGLAIDGLWFEGVSDQALVGTLHHGYYDDIGLGADFYTGHLVMEAPARPKVTDLNPVEPTVERCGAEMPGVQVAGEVQTTLGPVLKTVWLSAVEPRVEITYCPAWHETPIGSLRLGFVTLNPSAFERDTLFFRTHNGGWEPEAFPLVGKAVDHGGAHSFLVSARQAISLSQGLVELGDARHIVRVEVDKAFAALVGMVTYWEAEETYFCRLALSVGEVDETRRSEFGKPWEGMYRVRLSAERTGG